MSSNPPPSPSDQFKQQAEALIAADFRMISGCHSEQTSADVGSVNTVAQLPDPQGKSGGACTSALLDILYRERETQKMSFQDLLVDLRKVLKSRGFDQIPQLTSSRPLDGDKTPFVLAGDDGIKRALLVGINYIGQNGQLRGCHSDVFNMKKYLIDEHGYSDHNILVLVDDGNHHYPHRVSIIKALRQLVAQSVSGDSAFFHYSGHGGLLNPVQNPFKRGQNKYDETIYPLDHQRSGQIRDFSLFNSFVKPMPAGVTVTCLMDCCHSGAILELPYAYMPTSAGTIRMHRSIDNLSNLAMLHVLMGGHLPVGLFSNVTNNIEQVSGGNLEDFEGLGLSDENFSDIEGTEVLNDVAIDQTDVAVNEEAGAAVGGTAPEGVSEIQEPAMSSAQEYGSSPGDDMLGDGQSGESPGCDGDGCDGCDFEDTDCSCMGDILSSMMEL